MLPRRVAPADTGDLAMYLVRGLYDIGFLCCLDPHPSQVSERVLVYPEHNPQIPTRWDNDEIIGALNLTEPA